MAASGGSVVNLEEPLGHPVPSLAEADSIPGQIGAKAAAGAAAAAGPPRPRIPWRACHPVPILGAIPLSSGAGTLDQPDMYGPKDPYWWDLRDLVAYGFTAGTITVYLNSSAGQPLAVATVVGEFTWSANHLLAPRDRLVFVASGITGNALVGGQAVEIETLWLPEYLM